MKKYDDSPIYKSFDLERLSVIDTKQIEELGRWKLLDFESFPEYDNDKYVSRSKIISICGCGRSGTTLTRVMLDSHPQVYSGAESLLFLPIAVDAKDLSFKFETSENEINQVKDDSISRAQFIDEFKNIILKNNGNKEIWSDKTARNIHCLPYIFEHFSEAKVINVIRDPRDVVASLRTHKKRKVENGEIKNTGYIMPLSMCIDRWNKSVDDALPHRNNKNYMELRYEDLILDTENSLKNICDFCEIEFDSKMINFHENTDSSRNYNKFIQNIEATKPISSESIGRYKSIFSENEINIIKEQTQKNAEIIGYKF